MLRITIKAEKNWREEICRVERMIENPNRLIAGGNSPAIIKRRQTLENTKRVC